ncbi:MAG: hypothetical protein U0W40_15660 [Acidimicrobiia bacterium]
MGHRLRSTITATAAVTLAVLAATIGFAPAASASRASDVKDARAGVLVAGDFPAGWTGSRNASPSDAKAIAVASKIPSCTDYVKLRKSMVGLPQARSLEFDDGAGTQMDNNVRVFASSAKVNAAMKLFGSSQNPDCLGKITEAGLDTGWTATVEPTDLTGLPEGTVAYTADIADDSGTVVQQYRTIVVPADRFVAVYNIGVTTSTPPIDAIDAAANSSLTRLSDAIG